MIERKIIIFATLPGEKARGQKAILCFYPRLRSLENFKKWVKDIEFALRCYVFSLSVYIGARVQLCQYSSYGFPEPVI